jgi:site-specific recombinase XerD
MTDIDEVTLIPETTRERLNERQLADYRDERADCIEWLLAMGKDPDRLDGYALSTVDARASRMAMFYEWVWDQEGQYTTAVTHEHAEGWTRRLARQDKSNSAKSTSQDAVRVLFKWRAHERGDDPWEPELRFSRSEGTTQPRDYLTRDERKAMREAALEYGSVPSYNDLSPEQRSRWKAHLAQKFEKPKSEVTPDDWDRANGWMIPSLVWTSLDAGLRPIEVERAHTGWVDLDNEVLRIPKEESAKNEGHWVVGLRSRTADALERWLEQRATDPKYDDTDTIWLTQKGNPWSSSSLSGLIDRVAEEAGIDYENRSLTWYSIRHSVGTYMTREEDLAAAQAQLRHKSPQTTMKYDQVPVEDRKDALDRMG